MSIGYYCNREVIISHVLTTAFDAAKLMREHHAGSLVIVDKTGDAVIPKGIVTDRDLVVEIMATGLDPQTMLVSDFMTATLHTAREDEHVADVIRAMRSHGVRRMPIVDEQGRLVGIVAIDDLIHLMAEEMGEISRLIRQEIERESQSRK